ncbi:PPIC-type PPIASE domain-containing protein [Sarocladium implicatum]|nr:PPIC-type PPIASE domain-containing protein [Sarocladium implicatum]
MVCPRLAQPHLPPDQPLLTSFLFNLTPSKSSTNLLPKATGLPPNWEVRHSKSKDLPYYFNTIDKVSNWTPPPGTDTEKLKHYMATNHASSRTTTVGDQPPQSATDGKIWAYHLLVKHNQSRRPSSWREANITRSKEEAREILQGHERRIRSGEVTLEELAKTESDCSSAHKDGNLGWFGHGTMQQAFQDAAFKLEPGEMSSIVDTDSGLHLIWRKQ